MYLNFFLFYVTVSIKFPLTTPAIPIPRPESRLATYLKTHGNKYEFCNYFYGKLDEVRDILILFLKYNSCAAISGNSFSGNAPFVGKAQATYVFIGGNSSEEAILAQLREKNPFWKSQNSNYFILCNYPEINFDYLMGFLKMLARRHIINFLVITVNEDYFEFYSYNLFTGQTIFGKDQFEDKLQNLNGHPLRVSFFTDFPLTFKSEGKWVGIDYHRLSLVASIMNASIKLIEPKEGTAYFGAFNATVDDVTDFCFISHFYMNKLFQTADYTYPHESNQIVGIVPANLYHRDKITTIFSTIIWILLGFLLLFLSFIMELNQENFWESLLYNISCFLGNPYPNLKRKPFTIRVLVLVFIAGSINFRTAFQSFLVSTFITPKLGKQIKTIEELRASDFEIYSSISLALALPREYGLSGKLTIISPAERLEKLYNLDTSSAYIIIKTTANKFMESLNSKFLEPPFYIMNEALVPSLNTYIFQKHSPFLEKVNECLGRMKQHGLLNSPFSKPVGAICNQELLHVHNTKLCFRHLRFVFAILATGLLISFIVFALELIRKIKYFVKQKKK